MRAELERLRRLFNAATPPAAVGAADATEKIIADLKKQGDTAGFTAGEMAVYSAAMAGATFEELMQVRAQADLTEAQQKEVKRIQDLKKAAETLATSLATPFDTFLEKMEEMQEMLEKGLITSDEYALGLSKNLEALDQQQGQLSGPAGLQAGSIWAKLRWSAKP